MIDINLVVSIVLALAFIAILGISGWILYKLDDDTITHQKYILLAQMAFAVIGIGAAGINATMTI